MRKQLAIFALGLASALAFAPFNFFWVLFITFPLFLHQLQGVRGRAAFALGWLFGFGYFLAGLYWISAALFVDIAQFWWAVPMAAGALPMGLALFIGLAVWGAQHFSGYKRLLAFAIFWCAMEWLRGHIFTGLPWQLVAYAWVDTPFIKLAAYGGAYGLSLWAMLLVVLFAGLVRPGCKAYAAYAGLSVLLAGGYGAVLLRPAVPAGEGPLVRIVQPNIAQTLKLDPQMRSRNLQSIIAASLMPGTPDLVVWPETAVFYNMNDADVRQGLAHILPANAVLLTGTIRVWDEGQQRHYANSLQAMNSKGDLLGHYDKAHLVPFGEYIPFRSLIPLQAIASGVDFTVGPGPTTMQLPGLPPFSVRICYEAIFPGMTVDQANRPEWLVNITNDGWYGQTSGPYQHFEISRLRAVEEGLPLVRAANTGISGLVGADGAVLQATKLGVAATIDVRLPKALPPTPYSRYGDWPFAFVLLLGIVGIAVRKEY